MEHNKCCFYPKNLSTMLVMLIILLLPAIAGAEEKEKEMPHSPAEWTYIVYMDGDNNLEQFVVTDIENEYAAYGSSKDVNVVILADRTPGYDDRAGDWTSTKLFYMQKNMKSNAENALSDWGERNMGDPDTLAEFIKYCKTNYPAQKYALVLWDHGWAWHPGWFMSDKTSEDDSLDQVEIAAAMEEAGPVDVVGFDACEMQAVENQSLWKNYAKVAVGSEKSVWYRGLQADYIMQRLQKNPRMAAEELGVVMAKSLQDKDASAVALNDDWLVMEKEFAVLSRQLVDQMPTYLEQYRLIRTHLYDDFSPDSVDLRELCMEVKAHIPDPSIQNQCDKVIAAFDKAVLYDWHKEERFKDIYGISIFWPNTLDDYIDVEYYQNNIMFTKSNSWGKFIEKYMFAPERDFGSADAAQVLVDLGIYADTGNLNSVMTKAQLSSIYAKLAPKPNDGDIVKQSFRDVKESKWYSNAIDLAASYGWMEGSGGRFSPEEKMTYGDAVISLLKVLGYNDAGLTGAFPDKYYDKAGALNMFAKGYFNPDELITKGDFALLLNSALYLDCKYYDEGLGGYLTQGTDLINYKYLNDPADGAADTAAAVKKVPDTFYYATVTECFNDARGQKYIRVVEGNGAVADYYFDDIYAALEKKDLPASENAVARLTPDSFYGYHPTYSAKFLLDEIVDGTIVRLSFDENGKLKTFTRVNDDREWMTPVGKYYIEDVDSNTGAIKITDGIWSGWFTVDENTSLYDWTDDYYLTTIDQLAVGDIVVADDVNFDAADPANQVSGDEGRFLLVGNSKDNVLKVLAIEN